MRVRNKERDRYLLPYVLLCTALILGTIIGTHYLSQIRPVPPDMPFAFTG